jgi:tetratricopeptide (TPR) repeat protein
MIELLAFALLTGTAAAQDVLILPEGDGPGTPALTDEPPAQEALPAPLPEPAPVQPATLEEVWAELGPEAVLEDAVARRGIGDFEGADARLAWLAEVAPGEEPTYHAAVSAELQERYDDALRGYEAVLATWPEGGRTVDAGFRRALVLEELGRHRDAIQQVRLLQRSGDWSERDAQSLALARGVNELAQGRTRRGLRRLDKALAATEGSDDLRWMRAKARAALTRHLLDEAAGIPMVHGRRAGRNLEARAANISAAERQVIAIANLGEAEYALAGLELLGDAYIALHDDLIALPPPPELTPEQAEIYTQGVQQKTAVLRRKAWRYYDEGVKLATRTEWQGSIAGRLEARRGALDDAMP